MWFRYSFPARSSFFDGYLNISQHVSFGRMAWRHSLSIFRGSRLRGRFMQMSATRPYIARAGPYLPLSYVHYKRCAYFFRPERHLLATVDQHFFCSFPCHLAILAPLSHSSSLFRRRDGHSAKRHDPHNVIYAPSFAVACSLPATVLASLARGYHVHHGSSSERSTRSPCLSLLVNL